MQIVITIYTKYESLTNTRITTRKYQINTTRLIFCILQCKMQDTLAKNKNPKNTKRYALDSRFLVSRRKRTKILQKYQNNKYQKQKKKPKNIKKKTRKQC